MVMYFRTTHLVDIYFIFRLKEASSPENFLSQIENGGMNAEFSIGLSNGKFACSEFATK